MTQSGIYQQRLHTAEARIAELEAELRDTRTLLQAERAARILQLARARAEERERAARIADEWINHPACSPMEGYAGNMIAAAIRSNTVRDPTPPHRRSPLEHERDAGGSDG